MKRLMIIAVLFPLALSLFAQQKPRVAVQTIKANEVAKATTSVCRSFVETALIKTDVFNIINTADMDEVLKAQELSLADCTDESCAIQIGKLLSAELIVIGDLSAVGIKMALNLRLLDVASGKVLRAETVTVDSIEDLQGKAFVAAYSLAGMKYDPNKDIAVKETGEIYVTTPDGRVVDIYLDGVVKGRTPALLSNVPFGTHLIEAKDKDLQFSLEVVVKSKDILEIGIDPKLLRGNVLMSLQPKEASGFTLLIGDKEYKAGLIRDVPIGNQEITVKGGGWAYSGLVSVKTNETARMDIILQEVGELTVIMPNRANATAQREGKSTVISGAAPMTLPVGPYAIVIRHPDYEVFQTDVNVQRGKLTAVAPTIVHTVEYNRIQAVEKERQTKLYLLQDLRKQRMQVNGTRGVFTVTGWVGVGLGIIVSGIGAVLEGLISARTTDLNSVYTQYQSATVSTTAEQLWTSITSIQTEINGMRTFRTGSFIGAAVSGLAGGLLLLVSPSTVELDRRIIELEGTLR